MQPLLAMSPDREIMPPSPISNNQSRHGRGKHGGSVSSNKKSRQRGYSIIAERDSTVTRALAKLLKHFAEEDNELEEGTERLLASPEGWFSCEKVLENLETLDLTLLELRKTLQSPSAKARFTLKSISSFETESDSPSDYLIRLNTPSTPTTITSSNISIPSLEFVTISSADLPDFVVYETSYANYPLILASGGIRKAGGQSYLSFASIFISADATETRTRISSSKDDADVSIYISLKTTMESDPQIKWYRNGNGGILSEGDENGYIGKSVWKKVIARRADIGVLFEDGVVKKEVPVGLGGKGVKGKKLGKGKGNGWNKEIRARSEDEMESNED
ncbi:a642a292-3175-456f-97de-28e446111fea-CDS [Sclerotinia trifoliorum]|uniref:A642a292-3175-456f-97de-28e446111fea-CDS n=1 Tax=Sclerotinia trifoliorum TaxID=28548 RepID=A0A8H2VTK8_9HELO|nr:a642a292-3175-456f-97de-28e446111fea-CDS [Sclerotinia trifoliorum]